jgi:hypothetical protein
VAVVLAVGVAATTLAAAPAYASTWFRYPGISCGPDQHAEISMVTSGSGNVNVSYAYGSGGGIAFGGVQYRGAGNHSTVIPSRVLNSYDFSTSGATVKARGVSCQ